MRFKVSRPQRGAVSRQAEESGRLELGRLLPFQFRIRKRAGERTVEFHELRLLIEAPNRNLSRKGRLGGAQSRIEAACKSRFTIGSLFQYTRTRRLYKNSIVQTIFQELYRAFPTETAMLEYLVIQIARTHQRQAIQRPVLGIPARFGAFPLRRQAGRALQPFQRRKVRRDFWNNLIRRSPVFQEPVVAIT